MSARRRRPPWQRRCCSRARCKNRQARGEGSGPSSRARTASGPAAANRQSRGATANREAAANKIKTRSAAARRGAHPFSCARSVGRGPCPLFAPPPDMVKRQRQPNCALCACAARVTLGARVHVGVEHVAPPRKGSTLDSPGQSDVDRRRKPGRHSVGLPETSL